MKKRRTNPDQAEVFSALEMVRLDPEKVPTPTGPAVDPSQLIFTERQETK